MMSAKDKRLMIVNVEKRLSDEKSIMEDILNVYETGMFHDISFNCSDDIEVSSNKSFLSMRVPYFANMFFGSFQKTIKDKVDFKSCDSQTFTYILDFIWKGVLELEPVPCNTLMNIMETARMLCLDPLWRGVERHLMLRINRHNVDVCECLDILEFSVSYKFDSLLESLVGYMQRHLQKFVSVSKFTDLSSNTMMAILMGDFKESVEDTKFDVFRNWKTDKAIDFAVERQMLDAFDLKRFSCLYLLQTVQKTGYFKDEDIFSILVKNVIDYEEKIDQKDQQIKERDSIIRGKDREIGKKDQLIKEFENGDIFVCRYDSE